MQHSQAHASAHQAAGHRAYLYGFALKHVRDAHLADDLVQETLLAALQSASDYVARSTYRVWLTGILKHKMLDAFRERGRHLCLQDEAGDNLLEHDPAAFSLHQVADSLLPNPQKAIELRQLLRGVDQALQAMPEGISAVFFAREIEGESARAISRRFAISEANVWVRVHRARKAMQTFLTSAGLNERGGLAAGARRLSQPALEAS
ncbi:DNA-directed RNA polymerase sigma-70 factor [Sulfuriferula plumbiphila]|uniref:DNA-directed RNA polymerase sigma-70 factor n=1 Tax=Sulfuriferula plumbiphila TaxID=171865 RepID=A0A512L3F0_9PROT|nr:sigma-70 family RNA polymerase sigma factor [Sulfuriferula plumbiphila]BBP02710.1 DNA-directed RNA polymerase sigma-70 factor [Sulfuriferula plumbiphila]GEP29004.1 DNA-directed RNA polymerase sigma-70 factor [Sulfuriferula plumbiphila]